MRGRCTVAADESTLGAQWEVLEMISSHLLWGAGKAGGGRAGAGDAERLAAAASAWAVRPRSEPSAISWHPVCTSHLHVVYSEVMSVAL